MFTKCDALPKVILIRIVNILSMGSCYPSCVVEPTNLNVLGWSNSDDDYNDDDDNDVVMIKIF